MGEGKMVVTMKVKREAVKEADRTAEGGAIWAMERYVRRGVREVEAEVAKGATRERRDD